MDIRCNTCSKLFRIADEKIAGKGIRFRCSQCGEVITILREDLERDRLAREAPAAPQQTEAQAAIAPTPPPPPPQQPQASAPAPHPAVQEPEATTHQPPASSGLDDFDFSAPHEAAAGPERSPAPAEADPFADLKAETGQTTGPEISISEDEEKAAEEAFQFPADIISEPKRKSPFETAEGSEAATAGEAVPDAGPAPDTVRGPEKGAASSFPEELAYQESRAATEPPAMPRRPDERPAEEEEMDLGAALAIPQESAMPRAEEPRPESADRRGEAIHPFASGNATGALAGIGCGIPLAVLLLFGLGMLATFLPVFASLPVLHLVAAAVTGIIGMGVIVGLVVAALQASAGKKLFFLVNILIGTVFAAGVGLGLHALISFVLGKGIDSAALVARSVGWLVVAFLLSISVSIARRILVHRKEETFAEPLTGLQKAGLAVSLLVVLASLYADGALTGSMEKMNQEAAGHLEQLRQQLTPDGLTVVNASGHIDPASGDLIVAGTIQNSLDRQKPGWFLVVEVVDGRQGVLARMKMVNGAQAFTKRDMEVLAKRGAKIDELLQRFVAGVTQPAAGAIPAKGSVSFEMRLPDPPANAAAIIPMLTPFDPAVMFELTGDLKR